MWSRVYFLRTGCPVHAGIDPDLAGQTLRGERLPRPRGDRPEGEYVGQDLYEAAPSTRG